MESQSSIFELKFWKNLYPDESSEYANNRMQVFIKSNIQEILKDLDTEYPGIIEEKSDVLSIPNFDSIKSLKNATTRVFKIIKGSPKLPKNSLKVVHRKSA